MLQSHLYASFLLISAALSAVICSIAWKRRSAQGAVPLFFLALGLVWWSFTYALHWFASIQANDTFWLDATYVGVVAVPTSFLAFALVFTQRMPRIPRHARVWLAIEPLLTVALLWTDSWHGLFFGGTRSAEPGAILSGGVWFWVNVVYSYGLVLATLVILVQALLRAPRFQRRQVATVLAGAAMPILGNAVGLLKISPFPNLDITPMAFTLTALLFYAGLFRFHMLDIVPIARSLVIESMNDGVLVLDERNRIVDINQQACRLMGISQIEPLGQPAGEIIPDWPEMIERYPGEQRYQDILPPRDPRGRFIELHVTPIHTKEQHLAGRLAILRDITEKVRAEEDLIRMNADLQKKIEEIESLQSVLREQAVRDPLTGLYNRRYMEEILEQELAYAERNGLPVGVIYLDVDHFKQINDQHGHQSGDVVLQGLGRLLQHLNAGGDLPCRVGGDEFVVLLPGTEMEAARQRAEQVRQEFARLSPTYLDGQVRATLSLGISAYPTHGQHGDDLLRAADQAMYRAKGGGRNQVAVYQT